MARPEYVETACKTALNRVQGMPFRWSLNPYSGCAHRCRFCFAIRPYVQAEKGTPADFGARIFAKVNIADVLARELARPGWRGEHVVLGTATDVYQPAEGRFRLTRHVLEVLRDHLNPVSMLTKSPMVFRDLDILADLARHVDVRVYFSITTVDLDLWRTLEPGTANPLKRLAVMRRLREAGIQAGVFMAPILPGITDSKTSIEAVAAAARSHDAAFFGTTPLRLMPTVREHYLGFVENAFPDLLPRYEAAYLGVYAPREYRDRLAERVEGIRRRYDYDVDAMASREAEPPLRRKGPQLALPL